ncbi:MAG: tRNA (adenosine(37)-N6)-dimethylallyltransferase MiaA [Thermoanaerobacteraceae bacterium]
MPIPIVIIAGPTASGKTRLSIDTAKNFNGEIISADSMQIYKNMDIGTAKIREAEMENIPHYLIDIVDPDYDFSVAEFERMAKAAITDIYKRNKLPIIVGGTGLYINSIVYTMNFSDFEAEPEFRNKLKKIAQRFGSKILYNRLVKEDPETAFKIHPNDTKRIIRALEVKKYTGFPISYYQKESGKRINKEFNTIMIGLNFRNRELLYKRINDRVDNMIKNNLINEVEKLLKIGYNKNSTAMQALGYKEIIEYLNGKVSLDEATEKIKQNTRRYAKRQITWFKSYKFIKWFYVDDYLNYDDLKKNIFSYFAGKLQL